MSSTRIKAILFDKDGTLLDFQASWGGWAADTIVELAEGDPARAKALAGVLGVDLEQRQVLPGSVVIAGSAQEICDVMATVPGMGPAEALTNRVVAMSMDVRPVPLFALAPFLEELRTHGFALGVATNDAEAPTRAQLGFLGVLDLFDFVAGFDSGYGAKPGPGPCLAFANSLGVSPADCAMVGDSLHDLQAGGAAGMWRVAVASGLAGADSLAPHADVVLPDATHISKWLAQVAMRA